MANQGSTVPSQPRLVGALILVQLLFGVHYYASKIVIAAFPPVLWASVRTGVTAVLLYATASALRPRSRPALTRRFLAEAAGLSLLGTVINQACFLAGLARTTTSNSAVLNTTVPMFTLAFAATLGQERLGVRKIAGIALALVGVLFLIRIEGASLGSGTFAGDALTLVNCIAYAAFLALGKRFLERHDRFWATAWLFVFGAIGLALAALPDWLSFVPPALTAGLAVACAYTILGATFLAYLLINWVLAHTSASRVAVFVYLQPVVATLLGVRFLGETITARTVAGSALVFAGLALSTREAGKARRITAKQSGSAEVPGAA